MNTIKNKTVAVGMSGGVDSAITAYLLKKQGFSVIGLTMEIWDGPIECTALRSGCYGPNEADDVACAKKVAEQLSVKHHVVDLRTEYKKTVLGYFSEEYTRGRTPNPCVKCNAVIKFGNLLEKALASGIRFDLFATGHYARVDYDRATGRYFLRCGIDKAKDQSYFLHRLTQQQLSKVTFPLGLHYKRDVKAIAAEAGFGYCLKRPESQDFLEWDDYGALLADSRFPGNICDIDGKVIGTHRGIAFYTVGQRRALHLAGLKEPFYVLRINAETNEIIAGPKSLLLKKALTATQLHWIIPPEEHRPGSVQAKIRSAADPQTCEIVYEGEGRVLVCFAVHQESIAPGQSIVFYSGDIVLGGGIIERSRDWQGSCP